MALINNNKDNNYLSILADGTLRMTVPEGTEGAVQRTYETSDGKTGTKTEMVYTEVSGLISKVNFFEGDFGKLIQLTITDDGQEVVLSVPTSSNYGEDLMKKLPAVDMLKPVRLAPYSFVDDQGKSKKGVTVYQNEQKINNYFYDSEKKVNLHGYPEIPVAKKGKLISKEEWKIYFAQCRVFMIEYIENLFSIEKEDITAEFN